MIISYSMPTQQVADKGLRKWVYQAQAYDVDRIRRWLRAAFRMTKTTINKHDHNILYSMILYDIIL